jgi:1,5-anhydro-D-fructose reductase (1,5-anhydro-D-mannitol-forming)
MAHKVRYGIIGFGAFAENRIVPAFRASLNSELIAIQKRSLRATQEKARALDIPLAFDSAEALTAHPDVDAVFVASANALHAPHTLIAAAHGKHVIVEKPISLNAAEAQTMIDACRLHRVKFQVGHMLRLSPLVQRMKELIRTGRIGKVTSIRAEFIYDGRLTHRPWLTDRALAGGGPVYDVGVHCLDTMRFLLDDEVVSVKSQLNPQPTERETESTAQLALKFSRGTTGSIYCSYIVPVRRPFIEVMGERGILSAENFSWSTNTLTLKILRGEKDAVVESVHETIVVPNLYEKEISLFSECILNDSPVLLSGENALQNQFVLDEAMKG